MLHSVPRVLKEKRQNLIHGLLKNWHHKYNSSIYKPRKIEQPPSLGGGYHSFNKQITVYQELNLVGEISNVFKKKKKAPKDLIGP